MGRESSIPVRGQMARGLPRTSLTYERDRTCGRDGCPTRLSIYNRGPFCWAHRLAAEGIGRGSEGWRIEAA